MDEQLYCMNCGTPLEAGAAFCMECGAPAQQQGFMPDSSATTTTYIPRGHETTGSPSSQGSNYYQNGTDSDSGKRTRSVALTALLTIAIGVVALVLLRPILPFPGIQQATAPAESNEAETLEYAEIGPFETERETPEESPTENVKNNYEVEGPHQEEIESPTQDYLLPDSATKEYSKSELEKLSTYDLYLARNEIYARRGRLFKNQDLQDYFGKKDWYRGTIKPEDFDAKDSVYLSLTEQKNAKLMREIEASRNSPYLD